VDELDSEEWVSKDNRLEQQSQLAPETFTNQLIEYLYDHTNKHSVQYNDQIAKCLLNLPVATEKLTKLSISLVRGYSNYQPAIDHITSVVDDLEFADVSKLVYPFVGRALPPPPSTIMGNHDRVLDNTSIRSIYRARKSELNSFINELFDSGDLNKIRGAARTILAIDVTELYATHNRTVIGKLLRRNTLLKNARRDDDTIHYLKEVAVNTFKKLPLNTDKIIQSLLKDKNETVQKGATAIYRGAMRHRYRDEILLEDFHKIAFERLLWMAVDNPYDRMENEAANFFQHPWDEFKELAAEQMDGVVGAAAVLSEKLNAIDVPEKIIIAPTGLEEIEKNNQRSSVNSLQGALVAWAALGASAKGEAGIKDFLQLYSSLPDDQIQMQANVVAHFSKLMIDVRSMQLVLSDLYGALMHGDARIRASAVKVVSDVHYKVRENFPV